MSTTSDLLRVIADLIDAEMGEATRQLGGIPGEEALGCSIEALTCCEGQP